jgi:DNA-binding HxlR family transcriptional regulator
MKDKTLLVVIIPDKERSLILKVVSEAKEPLETREIEKKLPKLSRSKIMYRLNNLRAEGLIVGKQIGSGKKTWIWWKKK